MEGLYCNVTLHVSFAHIPPTNIWSACPFSSSFLSVVFRSIHTQGPMKLAIVGTGGDPGHAPARRSYEKAGYIGLPIVRYYKDL